MSKLFLYTMNLFANQFFMEILMREFERRNPYMDYRNAVPFMDLSGFIVRQPSAVDAMPVKSLQEYLRNKKFSTMVNFRRMQYCKLVEEYRNGRK